MYLCIKIGKIMGFWKTFFGGESNPEEEKKNAEERNFDLLKYDGVKAMRMGQYEYAVKCFLKALESQDDPEVHDYLSRAYTRQGKLDEALAEVKTLVLAEPDNIHLLIQASGIAYMKEDYAEMTALCQQAIELDPDHAVAHLAYARAELGQGNQVQAIARLTKAIALDENLVEPHLLRGQTLMQMGDFDGAWADAQWLTDRMPEADEDALLFTARLMAAKGDRQEAVEAYGKVVEVNPFQVDAYRERGRLRYEMGDKQGAEEDMQKVLELNPDEMADVSGEYSAEGIEQKTRQAYSNMNPFGIGL